MNLELMKLLQELWKEKLCISGISCNPQQKSMLEQIVFRSATEIVYIKTSGKNKDVSNEKNGTFELRE